MVNKESRALAEDTVFVSKSILFMNLFYISLFMIFAVSCTSNLKSTGSRNADPQNTQFVEALPHPEKLIVVVMPVKNKSGISDYDILSSTLYETINSNLNNMEEYEIVKEFTESSQISADYLLGGEIIIDETGELRAVINVITTENQQHDVLEKPVPSVMDVFNVADNLSEEVTQYFIDEIIFVGYINIRTDNKKLQDNHFIVDGKEIGTGFSELTLLAGKREIEIRKNNKLLYRSLLTVGDSTRSLIDLSADFQTELSLELIEAFHIPVSNIAPHGITWDGESYWLVNESPYEIIKLSPDGELEKKIEGPPGWLTGITFDGEFLWVGTFDSNGENPGGARGLYQLDLNEGNVLDFIPNAAGDLTGLAWDGESFWFADFTEDGLIHKLDKS